MAITSFPKDKIKILLLENIHPVAKAQFEKAGYTNVELLKNALPEDELAEKIKDVHLVGIRSKTQINQRIINAAEKLYGVGCFCIGTNQVDLDACTDKGIAVFNSPYSNTRSVAELVVAECVMLVRRIPERSSQAHKGVWLKDADRSHELRGKTLGIIGYGHIGSQVSVLAEGLGLNVVYYDIEPKLPLGNANAIDSLEELIKTSDIVTLHVPADPSTENLMNAERINMMKAGSYLLNLSRGNVVDLQALKARIEDNTIWGAALDVYPEEPKSKKDSFSSPMQGLKNVILTPHIGGSTVEAQENIGKDAAIKLIAYMDKGVTIGNHTIPTLNLPVHQNKHRILHIHRNEAGVLAKINSILGERNINVSGQYLKTNPKIGYVVLDIDADASDEVKELLLGIEQTIKVRVLY